VISEPSAAAHGVDLDPPLAPLLAAAEEILPWMIEIRRDLHQHPELGLEEHRTSARVLRHLEELAIPHVEGLGGTGVMGLVRGDGRGRAGEGPAVALRADLDALPLDDRKDVPYRSTVPGRMHACGHDVHTAVLLGAARLLAGRREEVAGTVKLLFQPAEETVGGARLLIDAGVLEDPTVSAIFGLHVEPTLAVGTVGVSYGQRNASSDTITLVIHGQPAHGAYPSGGVDGIVAAAQVISAVQTVVSRNIDARDAAVITFGTIHGGTQGNILAGRVEIVGTVRCLAPAIRERVLQRLRETAEGVAASLGARAEIRIEPGYEALVNSDREVDLVRTNAERMLGPGKVTVLPRPNMGVEDFAFYLGRVPGAFYSLGVRNEARGIVHPIHSELFDADERCLAVGAALQAANALTALKRARPTVERGC